MPKGPIQRNRQQAPPENRPDSIDPRQQSRDRPLTEADRKAGSLGPPREGERPIADVDRKVREGDA